MRLWTSIPRGVFDRITGVLPDWWWVWLRQLREIGADRRWNASQGLRALYPELAAPPTFESAEARVYSQNGEDGLIAWILAAVGVGERTFVEFGVGDGTECNSANLARAFGWSGLLMEADEEKARSAQAFYERFPGVAIINVEVTPDNIDALVRAHAARRVDLLSIDIDGNDYWVWRALTAIEPRLVVIEYNATFGPMQSVTVPHKPGFSRYAEHLSGFYHGASLVALTKLGAEKGYALLGCDSRGVNAFLARRDLLAEPLREVAPQEAWRPIRERAHLTREEQFAQIRHLDLIEV